MNKNIKICFMGSPEFGKIVLEKLIEEYNVVLVVTQPDSFTKGGKVLIEQPVKKLALINNIPIFQPQNIKEDFSEMKIEIRFCPNCGTKRINQLKFCTECGARLGK